MLSSRHTIINKNQIIIKKILLFFAMFAIANMTMGQLKVINSNVGIGDGKTSDAKQMILKK